MATEINVNRDISIFQAMDYLHDHGLDLDVVRDDETCGFVILSTVKDSAVDLVRAMELIHDLGHFVARVEPKYPFTTAELGETRPAGEIIN